FWLVGAVGYLGYPGALRGAWHGDRWGAGGVCRSSQLAAPTGLASCTVRRGELCPDPCLGLLTQLRIGRHTFWATPMGLTCFESASYSRQDRGLVCAAHRTEPGAACRRGRAGVGGAALVFYIAGASRFCAHAQRAC